MGCSLHRKGSRMTAIHMRNTRISRNCAWLVNLSLLCCLTTRATRLGWGGRGGGREREGGGIERGGRPERQRQRDRTSANNSKRTGSTGHI